MLALFENIADNSKFEKPASAEEPSPSAPSAKNRSRIISRIEGVIAPRIRENQSRRRSLRS